jgi:hypothetical protein
MENLNVNLSDILIYIAVAYPPLMFLLPASVASKISIGVKVIKTIANTLETIQNTKGGLSTQQDIKEDITKKKTFVQKSRLN